MTSGVWSSWTQTRARLCRLPCRPGQAEGRQAALRLALGLRSGSRWLGAFALPRAPLAPAQPALLATRQSPAARQARCTHTLRGPCVIPEPLLAQQPPAARLLPCRESCPESARAAVDGSLITRSCPYQALGDLRPACPAPLAQLQALRLREGARVRGGKGETTQKLSSWTVLK